MGLVGVQTVWIAAIAAVAIALAALALTITFWLRLGRVRSAQKVLLGGAKSDLVDFAVSLQTRIDDLHGAVDEVAAALARVDRRVDSSLTNRSIVRFDATPEATANVRARFVISVIPPCFTSSVPAREPSHPTRASRKKPVGGRRSRADDASFRTSHPSAAAVRTS